MQNYQKGCLYGDQIPECTAAQCGATLNDGDKYSDICCETCATETITPTSTEKPISIQNNQETSTKKEEITVVTSTSTENSISTQNNQETSTKKEEIAGVTGTSTTGTCTDGSGFAGVSCPEYIAQRGKALCYQVAVQASCCQTCQSFKDNTIIGCEYGDKDDVCTSLDFTALTECSPTTQQQCCKSCTDLVRPPPPVDCVDGEGIGRISCPDYISKYGKINCYENKINRSCCRTCHSYKDFKDTDCMFGDRTTACNYMKIVDYPICNDFTKTYCCATCKAFDELRKKSTSGVGCIRPLWTLTLLIAILGLKRD